MAAAAKRGLRATDEGATMTRREVRGVFALVTAGALGSVAGARDGLLLAAFTVGLVACFLLGWSIRGVGVEADRRDRRVVLTQIERHRAFAQVEAESYEQYAARSGSGIRFTGPTGDRHPAMFTRYDPDDDEGQQMAEPAERWHRTR